jgi:hypothetical protein
MNGRVDGILNKGMRVYLSVVVREARAGQLSTALAETSLPKRKITPLRPRGSFSAKERLLVISIVIYGRRTAIERSKEQNR